MNLDKNNMSYNDWLVRIDEIGMIPECRYKAEKVIYQLFHELDTETLKWLETQDRIEQDSFFTYCYTHEYNEYDFRQHRNENITLEPSAISAISAITGWLVVIGLIIALVW